MVAARARARRARRWPTASSGRPGRSCRPPAGSTRRASSIASTASSRGSQAPDEELVRACLAAYALRGERGRSRTEDELGAAHRRTTPAMHRDAGRLRPSARAARLDRGARARPGVGRARTLVERLADDERRVYLPLVVRAPADALGAGRRALVRARPARVPVRGRLDGDDRRGGPATRTRDPARQGAGALPGHSRPSARSCCA